MREVLVALLDDVLRPLVEADGGQIELVDVEDDRVVFRLSSACAGCPGAHYTKTRVIEPAVREAVGHPVDVVVEQKATNPPGGQPSQ